MRTPPEGFGTRVLPTTTAGTLPGTSQGIEPDNTPLIGESEVALRSPVLASLQTDAELNRAVTRGSGLLAEERSLWAAVRAVTALFYFAERAGPRPGRRWFASGKRRSEVIRSAGFVSGVTFAPTGPPGTCFPRFREASSCGE